jgi:hypothetical protein
MNETERIMQSIARELERRRREACVEPEFPGGPSAYRYVPEKCVLIARRRRQSGQASAPSRRASHHQQQVTTGSRAILQNELEQVRRILQREQESNAERAAASAQRVRETIQKHPKIIAVAKSRAMKRRTSLMMRAVELFKDCNKNEFRERYPNVSQRFDFVVRDDPPDDHSTLKLRVMTIMEAHLEILLQ